MSTEQRHEILHQGQVGGDIPMRLPPPTEGVEGSQCGTYWEAHSRMVQ